MTVERPPWADARWTGAAGRGSGPRIMARTATLSRKTSETDISLTLSLDGSGQADIATGIGFLDHMLTALARHGLFDLTRARQGRPAHRLPPHHRGCRHRARPGASPRRSATSAASAGSATRWCRWTRRWRKPRSISPAARSWPGTSAFERPKIGEMDTELFEEFFRAFAINALLTLHVTQPRRPQRAPRRRGLLQGDRAGAAHGGRSSIRASATPSPRPRGRCEVLDRASARRRRAGAGARGLQPGARCSSARSGWPRIAPGSRRRWRWPPAS